MGSRPPSQSWRAGQRWTGCRAMRPSVVTRWSVIKRSPRIVLSRRRNIRRRCATISRAVRPSCSGRGDDHRLPRRAEAGKTPLDAKAGRFAVQKTEALKLLLIAALLAVVLALLVAILAF